MANETEAFICFLGNYYKPYKIEKEYSEAGTIIYLTIPDKSKFYPNGIAAPQVNFLKYSLRNIYPKAFEYNIKITKPLKYGL